MDTRNPSRSRAAIVVLVLVVSACSLMRAPPSTSAPPRYDVPRTLPEDSVALVLSGGSARGFAHVGVIKVLEANGLRPQIIVGSSAGALVGALYASGLTAAEIERAAASLDLGLLDDWIVPGTGFFHDTMGLTRASNLRDFVRRWARTARMEDYPIGFAAVATELHSGEPAIFNAGEAGLAVLASCAIPGLVAPVRIGKRLYADGQIASPLPVSVARSLGGRRVVAVDVLYPPQDAQLSTALDVLFQANIVAAYRLMGNEAASADLVIRPRIPRTSGQYGFEERERLIAAGEEAATQALPALRALFMPRRNIMAP